MTLSQSNTKESVLNKCKQHQRIPPTTDTPQLQQTTTDNSSSHLCKGPALRQDQDLLDYLSPQLLPSLETNNEYDFFHDKRGRALVINNTKFISGPQRHGGRHDTSKLFDILSSLNFDVEVSPNLTASEMRRKIQEAASLSHYDHTRADCFLCIILTHGSHELDRHGLPHDVVFGVDSNMLYTSDIINLLSDDACPHFVHKPRIFIFQACRGDDLDQGQEVTEMRPVKGQDHRRDTVRGVDDATSPCVGSQARQHDVHDDLMVSPTTLFRDFLVVYATPPGYSAWRGREGSYYIQYLSEVFHTCHREHVSFIKTLTRTAHKMARLFKSKTTDSSSGKKQMPCIMSMLTKDICFRRKAVFV